MYQNFSLFVALRNNFRGPPQGSQPGPAFTKAGTAQTDLLSRIRKVPGSHLGRDTGYFV
jgi:hypothetical protein